MELLFPLLILVMLVPMFLGIRRQKKEMAKTSELQDSLSVGDRVTTTAGLYGTVAGLDDTTVDLEIAPGVVTTWLRMAIRERVIDDTTADDESGDETGTPDLDETPEQTQLRLDKD